MAQPVSVNFKLDADVKKSMEQACADMGLSMSAAFTIFAILPLLKNHCPKIFRISDCAAVPSSPVPAAARPKSSSLSSSRSSSSSVDGHEKKDAGRAAFALAADLPSMLFRSRFSKFSSSAAKSAVRNNLSISSMKFRSSVSATVPHPLVSPPIYIYKIALKKMPLQQNFFEKILLSRIIVDLTAFFQ